MRKTFITVVTTLIIIVLIIGGWLYIASFHTIDFSLTEPGSTVDIYENDQKIATVTTSGQTLRLRAGEYRYVAKGEKIGEYSDSFTISSDGPITINPPYSDTYLTGLLVSQEKAIHDIIAQTYPALMQEYTIQPGRLYEKGEWYGTLLVYTANNSLDYDLYRILLRKDSETWRVIRYPEIVVTRTHYPDVPLRILTRLNDEKFDYFSAIDQL